MSTTFEADSLAPATFRESVAYVAKLPSRPMTTWWILAALNFAATLTAMMFTSWLIGQLVDLVNGHELPIIGGGTRAFTIAVILIALGLFIEVFGRALGGQYLLVSRARRLSVDLREKALSSALRAPIPDMLELGTGNVISRLTKDIDTPIRMTNTMGVRIVITALIFPFTLVTISFVHWSFLAMFILVGLIMYPFARANIDLLPDSTNAIATMEARRNNMLLDTIRGLPTLRALGLEDWGTKRLEKASWRSVQATADQLPLFSRLAAHGQIAYGLLVIISLILATYLISIGELSLGEGTTAVILISRMEIHVFNLIFFSGEIQHAMTSLGRAVALARLDVRNDQPQPEELTAPPFVHIDGLSFNYPGGSPILSNLNLELKAGTTTALVGTSGAGKSTLAAIIAGLLRPTAGRILVGGVDISQVPDAWTARQVSLISQEVHLFSGTLRDDLHMASPQSSDEELISALSAVGLSPDSLQWERWLPEGLDTKVGAGAHELAPEVQQQISLARMILLDPPVLIMDEATAEAGSENARALESAAQAVAKHRTSLVVAHRLDQARAADRILLMEQGEIVEDGTHEELIEKQGMYAKLYSRWARA